MRDLSLWTVFPYVVAFICGYRMGSDGWPPWWSWAVAGGVAVCLVVLFIWPGLAVDGRRAMHKRKL